MSRRRRGHYANTSERAVARLRPDGDLDVLAERSEQAHETLTGEIRQPSVQQSRYLRLINLHERRGGRLSESTALDDLPDMAGKLRFVQLFLRRLARLRR